MLIASPAMMGSKRTGATWTLRLEDQTEALVGMLKNLHVAKERNASNVCPPPCTSVVGRKRHDPPSIVQRRYMEPICQLTRKGNTPPPMVELDGTLVNVGKKCTGDSGSPMKEVAAEKQRRRLEKQRQRRLELVANFKCMITTRKADRNAQLEQRAEREAKLLMLREQMDEETRSNICRCHATILRRHLRSLRTLITTDDFEVLRLLGQGGYGTVYKVRYKRNGQIYALKQVAKSKVSCKNSRNRQLAERDVLAELQSHYVVRLEFTFQDQHHLYQVLEFLDGGNLLDWMHSKSRFTEATTKFYVAELVHAVHAVHQLGYVHRDIKPDNIVLTSSGHLKLLDFGLAKFAPSACILGHPPALVNSCSTASTAASMWELASGALEAACSGDRIHGSSTDTIPRVASDGDCPADEPPRVSSSRHQSPPSPSVSPAQWNHGGQQEQVMTNCGTVMYTAPEVLKGLPYNNKVDWWAVGVIMFEALYGGVPFYVSPRVIMNEQQRYWQTVTLVVNHRKTCPIPYPLPDSPYLTEEAMSLLRGLICESESRLTGEEIMCHPWFDGIDWDHLHEQTAPFSAELTRPDRSYAVTAQLPPFSLQNACHMDLLWLHYDFFREAAESKPTFSRVVDEAAKQKLLQKAPWLVSIDECVSPH